MRLRLGFRPRDGRGHPRRTRVGCVEVRVPVAGGTLWAQDTGGDWTPLVLIHADWTDSGIWDPLIPLLHDRYRLIRYKVMSSTFERAWTAFPHRRRDHG